MLSHNNNGLPRWKCSTALFVCFAYFTLFCSNVHCDQPTIVFSNHDLEFEQIHTAYFTVILSELPNDTIVLRFTADRDNIVTLTPSNLTIGPDKDEPLHYNVTVKATHAGKVNIALEQDKNNTFMYEDTDAYTRVSIKVHSYLDTVDDVIGWIYFVAWSVSFYPQIWINFRRRSVIGLNLDYVSLNILGFFCYSMYNCGLFFIPAIQVQYFNIHEYGVMPVQIQDVVFALHALFASMLTGIEALIFDRGPQRVSYVARAIHGLACVFLILSLILSATSVITWLDYLYYFSYVKLAITIIKYMPQAYFNFRRKSTKGWSIGNILLDFTGGAMSMIQMFIIAYNYDDWGSLFGDPTKFGLSLFSILFDVLFIVQHYLLYGNKKSSYENIERSPSAETALEKSTSAETVLHRDSPFTGYSSMNDTKEKVEI